MRSSQPKLTRPDDSTQMMFGRPSAEGSSVHSASTAPRMRILIFTALIEPYQTALPQGKGILGAVVTDLRGLGGRKRASSICVRTEYTAISGLRFQHDSTAQTLVEKDAAVYRHRLGCSVPAGWTSNCYHECIHTQFNRSAIPYPQPQVNFD